MKRSEERKLFTWLVHGAKCTGAGFFFWPFVATNATDVFNSFL